MNVLGTDGRVLERTVFEEGFGRRGGRGRRRYGRGKGGRSRGGDFDAASTSADESEVNLGRRRKRRHGVVVGAAVVDIVVVRQAAAGVDFTKRGEFFFDYDGLG